MPTTFRATLSARRIRVAPRLILGGDDGDGGVILPGVLSYTAHPRVVSESGSSEIIDRDAALTRFTGASTVTDYQMIPLSFGGAGAQDGQWASSNPSVATVDANGFVTHVSDGVATITFTVGEQSASRMLTFSTTVGTTTDLFVRYVDGSLAHHVSTEVDERLSGKSASNALRIFTTQNHSGQIYVRNPNVWCADWDLTCMSPWNSSGGARRAGTLISPRHIIFAAHYQIDVGATVRFVKSDGTVVDRTMTARKTHPAYSPYYPDITIGLLDSDVPGDIGFAKVLPDNWTEYLPSLSSLHRLPALTLDQEEKALVTDWYRDTSSSAFIAPSDPKRLEFYEAKIGGDSGNPAFICVNGDLVILTVWTYGGAGSGTSITYQKTAINQLMTDLGGGYQLTEVDLSGFENFNITDDAVLHLNADTLQLSEDADVTSWVDSKNSLTASAPSSAPKLKTFNGHKGVWFDGTDDYLALDSPLLPTDAAGQTWFAVIQVNNAGGGSDGRRFIFESRSATSTVWPLSAWVSADGTRSFVASSYLTSGFTGNVTHGEVLPTSSIEIGAGRLTFGTGGGAGTLQVFRNSSANSVSTSVGTATTFVDSTGLNIGTFRGTNNRWFSGHIFRILIFDRTLTDSEMDQVFTWLSHRYSVDWDADSTAYFDQLSGQGVTLSPSTMAAVDNFVKGLKSDNVWDDITEMGLFTNEHTLAGSLVKLKGSGTLTNTGFVEGDLASHGLKGGTGKSLNTGVTGVARGNVHLGVYLTESNTASAAQSFIGTADSTVDFVAVGRMNAGADDVYQDASNSAQYAAVTVGTRNGHFIGSSESTSARYLYRNASLIASNLTAGSGVTTRANPITLFNLPGTPISGNYSNARIAFYHIGTSLDAAKVAALSSRVNTLMTALGINVY